VCHHAPHTQRLNSVEHVADAADVHRLVLALLLHHTAQDGSGVHGGLAAIGRLAHAYRIGDGPFDTRHAHLAQRAGLAPGSGPTPNLVSPLDQLLADVGADEARAAGDEDDHACFLPSLTLAR